ncbi:MAG TPA: hypothetical protein VJP40_10245, partial [bacterium]|nr:hypothetical protein [bacterium]
MKLFITLLLSSAVCILAYDAAGQSGLSKFTTDGLLMVLSGGYLLGAIFDFILTIPPILLAYSFLRLLWPQNGLGWWRYLASFYLSWSLYLILVQFTAFPFFGKAEWIFDYLPFGFFEGLYFFSKPWQAIGPSLGGGFCAGIFCLLAYRRPESGPWEK